MCRPVGLNLDLGRELRAFHMELAHAALLHPHLLEQMRMMMCGVL